MTFLQMDHLYLVKTVPSPLKRLRRQKSEATRPSKTRIVKRFVSSLHIYGEDASCVKQKSSNIYLDQLKKKDIYKSSPCLLNPSFSFNSNTQNNRLTRKGSSSTVQFTGRTRNKTIWIYFAFVSPSDWGQQSSLITLNFQKEEDDEHSDDEVDNMYGDDSDSGVSSLYACIRTGNTTDHGDDTGQDKTFEDNTEKDKDHLHFLVKRYVRNDHLQSVFFRDITIVYRSSILNVNVVTGDIQNRYRLISGLRVRNVREFKDVILANVKTQRKTIDEKLRSVRKEEIELNKHFLAIENKLMEITNMKVFRTYRNYFDKIEPLVNLIFGLEVRINEKTVDNCSDCGYLLKNQLVEAVKIKTNHDSVLKLIIKSISDKLGDEVAYQFRSCVRLKQNYLCQIRALNREIYFIQVQLQVLNCMDCNFG